jgi:hypothetical protein
MSVLAQQRCFNHAAREAVARCTACHQHFCRECVTEHDDRMLCAPCLARQLSAEPPKRAHGRALLRIVQGFTGLIILWLGFYVLGLALLELPSDVHEGSLWEAGWFD